MMRVLLYGEVDLNLIDGSSVWLVSLADLLARSGEIELSVLQRTRIERDVLVRDLADRPEIRLVDPWRDPELARLLPASAPRLAASSAAAAVAVLDERRRFDVVLVRGVGTAALLAEDARIAPRLWSYVTDPLHHRDDVEQLRAVFAGSARLLCQTEEARELFLSFLDSEDGDRIALLPPLVPDPSPSLRTIGRDHPRLVYSGKFSPPYRTLEMLDAFDRIRELVPGAEFHVVGDKFHNTPPIEGFAEEVERRLTETPGVIWHGGVPRSRAAQIVGTAHVACSWRDATFDKSVEISTKTLECAALGLPVLLNPTRLQRRIFGDDYPGYVASADDVVERFVALASSPEAYERAAERARTAVEPFTARATLRRLLPLVRAQARAARPPAKRPLRILFAGHDFKFLTPIRNGFENDSRFIVSTDEYRGHVIQDTTRSERLLRDADVVFCEWCLGNAEWYSQHKCEGQVLVVRFHSQERNLRYLDEIAWENVDALVHICAHHMEAFLERFPELADRTHLVYNAVECHRLDRPKDDEARFALGLLGTAPRQKSPHLALDLLLALRERDERYRLHVKGRHPWEYDWLWRRPDERAYYEQLYARFEQPDVRDAVVFHPHGDDVPAWLSQIGFVLSLSEHEGSHQAVAEGMASGAVPVIRDWHGADGLYPLDYVFHDVDEAVALVRRFADRDRHAAEGARCRAFARQSFDVAEVTARFERLILDLVETARARPTAGVAA